MTIELPNDLAEQIRKSSGDIGQRKLGVRCGDYRSGAMTGWHVQRLLGL